MRWLQEINLEGDHVRLIPLRCDHRDDLLTAASDGSLSRLWYTSVPDDDTIDSYLQKALDDYEQDLGLAFTVVDKASDTIIGTTRYTNAVPAHRRLEIGYTWYSKRFQRTAVNTECKLLLLIHAFEMLNSIAVEFRTNWYNFASRAAIARLGAKQDGVLRNHQILSDGTLRDTVVFSIIQNEWLACKKSLMYRLGR